MLFNSVFTIFWDFNIQCRVCYTACSVNRRETVSLFKFPIKSLMIPFELNWPVSLITIYILYVIITIAIWQHPKYYQNTQTQLHSSQKMDKKAHRIYKLWKIIYDQPNEGQNHRDAVLHGTNIITGPRCSVKYGRSFAGEFWLYKLQTWLIRTGLRSQTTSAIIINDWRWPDNTNPVRIGL